MNDFDPFDALDRLDSQGRLARAAQVASRAGAAAAAAEACLGAAGLEPPLPQLPVVLHLPPELHPIGEIATALCKPGTVTLARSPLQLGQTPQAQLHVGGEPVSLAPHVNAAAHPAETLLALVGLLAALAGQPPPPGAASEQIAASLARCHASIPAEDNPAKQLALRIHERIPCFWGTGIEAVAARAWAVRLIWHAESMAVATDQDDLSRVLVMARFARFWPNAAVYVRLAAAGEPDPVAQAVGQLLTRRRFAIWEQAAPSGLAPLARALYWLELGEWVTLYAAALNNVDPAAQVPLEILFGAA